MIFVFGASGENWEECNLHSDLEEWMRNTDKRLRFPQEEPCGRDGVKQGARLNISPTRPHLEYRVRLTRAKKLSETKENGFDFLVMTR